MSNLVHVHRAVAAACAPWVLAAALLWPAAAAALDPFQPPVLGSPVLPAPGLKAAPLGSEVAPEELRKRALDATARPQGWKKKLAVGATGSLNHTTGVVGAEDGARIQLGLLLDGSAELVRRRHEWLTALKVVHVQARDTVLERFVKSADSLDVATTYLYRLEDIKWLGPYGRGRLSTQIFDGYLIKPDPVTVRRIGRDGDPDEIAQIAGGDQVDLTGPFEPMVVLESVGLFAHPTEDKALTVRTKLGVGMQHVIARDGYALNDNKETPELDLVPIESSAQAGAELELALNGEVGTNVTWKASGNVFLPVYSAKGDDAVGIDGLSTELLAALRVKLGKWASLDYTFGAKRIPAVVKRWQLLHGVLVTVAFDVL